jgi:glycerophosphoryl diester phosphodiesterase
MTYRQLKQYLVDRNPEPRRFPEQRAEAGPLAQWYAEQNHLPPFAIPTLADVFEFVSAYAGQPGEKAGKPEQKRQRAAAVSFNIELKRDPKRPENIPDHFDGQQPARFELAVWETIKTHRVSQRCIIQCFDWRVLPIFLGFDPNLDLSALLDTAPPADLTEQLAHFKASIYSPNHQRLTEALTKTVQQSGRRVIPYTVNEEARMATLLDWGVDGIITDYPDRLLRLAQSRHLDY